MNAYCSSQNWHLFRNTAEKHDAFEFYKDAERKTRRLTKLLTAFMLGNITIAVYAAVYINAGYQIFVLKNHNATDWYLPFNTMWVLNLLEEGQIESNWTSNF